MNLKLIGCNILRRELFALAALSPHEIDLTLLPCDALREDIQKEIDLANSSHEYILLALGERATAGLCANSTPLVAARAHSCAHLLLGSSARYARAFSENDDDPCWFIPKCSRKAYGTPCAVFSPYTPSPFPTLPEGAREYSADLSLLRDLLFVRWDERFVTAAPGERIVSDPVDILTVEPV